MNEGVELVGGLRAGGGGQGAGGTANYPASDRQTEELEEQN